MTNSCFGAALLIVSLSPCSSLGQYRGDHVRYANISLEELPAALERTPDALLIDVRSPGEFHDTSQWASLNIGRLKGARNIDHEEVIKRPSVLAAHRDQPIYLYCSHSQRSRRVGMQLADSGYTHVVNVDGGLSRYWNEQDRLGMMDGLIERSATYGILNPKRLCEFIAQRHPFVLDVRPDSAFGPGPQYERMRAFGSLNGSERIPLEQLAERTEEIPRDRPVVLVGEGTAEGARAATVLQQAGFTDVHVLFNGLTGMLDADQERCPCKNDLLRTDVPYRTVALAHVDTLAILAGRQLVLDIRPTVEFECRSPQPWANTGHFKNARNIPADQLRERIGSLGIRKSDPLLLVANGLDDALFNAAHTLSEMGHSQVSVLTSSCWDMRWQAHNLPGQLAWDTWVVPCPPPVK